jgi:hypothetical protein
MARHPADTTTYTQYKAKEAEYRERGLLEMAKWAKGQAEKAKKAGRL